MPNTKSAKKRLQQSEQRRLRNRAARTRLRSQVRKVRELIASGASDKAQEQFRAAARELDQAGAKGLIHPNKAARIKSRLSKRIKMSRTPANPSS